MHRRQFTHYSPQSLVVPQSSNFIRRRYGFALEISIIDVNVPDERTRRDETSRKNKHQQQRNQSDGTILSWNDILPLSMYAAACLVGAIIISTYEDYDVTHTRPSPSTLRQPTMSSSKYSTASPWRSSFNFIGAATRGMGWGPSDRGIPIATEMSEQTNDGYSFEEWYGTSAATLQWKPSYNEIMLQHRSERVPRWNELGNMQTTTTSSTANSIAPTKEKLKQAVLHLYQSLDELESLKSMADDYRWDEMKEHLNPTPNTLAPIATSENPLPLTLEYSMDILKSIPSSSAPTKDKAQSNSYSNNVNELPNLIGFDWGSCAWRHCGAKADAQEAIAELYSNVGMLEPFECRFILGEFMCILSDGMLISVVRTSLSHFAVSHNAKMSLSDLFEMF